MNAVNTNFFNFLQIERKRWNETTVGVSCFPSIFLWKLRECRKVAKGSHLISLDIFLNYITQKWRKQGAEEDNE